MQFKDSETDGEGEVKAVVFGRSKDTFRRDVRQHSSLFARGKIQSYSIQSISLSPAHDLEIAGWIEAALPSDLIQVWSCCTFPVGIIKTGLLFPLDRAYMQNDSSMQQPLQLSAACTCPLEPGLFPGKKEARSGIRASQKISALLPLVRPSIEIKGKRWLGGRPARAEQ